MPTARQTAAVQALAAKAFGDILPGVTYLNGEPVADFTWNNRGEVLDALISYTWDQLLAYTDRTDNPNQVTLAQVLAADHSTQVPSSQIDPTIARVSYVNAQTRGVVNSLVTAQTIIDEVIAARGVYSNLDTRLQNLVMAGTSQYLEDIFTLGQMLTRPWEGTIASGAYLVAFTSGSYYEAGARFVPPPSFTFSAQPTPVTVYLYAEPGGLLVESDHLAPSLGLLLGSALVDATAATVWTPVDPWVVFDDSVHVKGDLTVDGVLSSPVTDTLLAVAHAHHRGDCTQTITPAVWDMPINWDPLTANALEIWRRGQELSPVAVTVNTVARTVTILNWSGPVDPDEWIYAKWTE